MSMAKSYKCGLDNCPNESIGMLIVTAQLATNDPVFRYENGMPKDRLDNASIPIQLPLCGGHLNALAVGKAQDSPDT